MSLNSGGLDEITAGIAILILTLAWPLYVGKDIIGEDRQENPYGRVVLSANTTTSWLHLASWNLPDSQLSWESKMEPSVAKNLNERNQCSFCAQNLYKNKNLCPGIIKIPISKLRSLFWHYQDNPPTPFIHCLDTIDSKLSIFNKKNLYGGWVGGLFLQEIIPLRGSILQVGTCQIFSLAENPRWSRVWQLR